MTASSPHPLLITLPSLLIAPLQDITEYASLGLTRQLALPPSRSLIMPAASPPVAARIFEACTATDPRARPSAADMVEWLREAAAA